MIPQEAGTGARGSPAARTPPGWRLVPWVVLAAALAAAVTAGARGRRFADRPVAARCAAAEDALLVWRRLDVRGRVLVHVDRPLGIATEPGATPAESYVGMAVRENRVRRVVHVISAAEWPQAEANLRALPGARPTGRGYRIVHEGLPIEIVRLDDLPPLGEPVVMDADLDRLAPEEQRALAARLGAPGLRADVVAWRGHAVPALLEALEALR